MLRALRYHSPSLTASRIDSHLILLSWLTYKTKLFIKSGHSCTYLLNKYVLATHTTQFHTSLQPATPLLLVRTVVVFVVDAETKVLTTIVNRFMQLIKKIFINIYTRKKENKKMLFAETREGRKEPLICCFSLNVRGEFVRPLLVQISF